MRNRLVDDTLYNIQCAMDHLNSTRQNILSGNFDNTTLSNVNRQLSSVNNTMQYIHSNYNRQRIPNIRNIHDTLNRNSVNRNSVNRNSVNTMRSQNSIGSTNSAMGLFPQYMSPISQSISQISHPISQSGMGIWDITNQLMQQMQQSQLLQNPQNVRFEQYDTPNGFHVSVSEFNSETNNDPSGSFIDSIMRFADMLGPTNSEGVSEGLSEEYKKKLPKSKYKDAKTDDDDNSFMCTICQEEYNDETEVLCLPCTHLFHEKCIDGWLGKSIECPNCRSNIIEDISRL